jgi:hypothetical protein
MQVDNETLKFFADAVNIQKLRQCQALIQTVSMTAPGLAELPSQLGHIVDSMLAHPAEYDRFCPTNIKWIENLIFSGLIANEENLPSTFDGTEQLAKLIKSVRAH